MATQKKVKSITAPKFQNSPKNEFDLSEEDGAEPAIQVKPVAKKRIADALFQDTPKEGMDLKTPVPQESPPSVIEMVPPQGMPDIAPLDETVPKSEFDVSNDKEYPQVENAPGQVSAKKSYAKPMFGAGATNLAGVGADAATGAGGLHALSNVATQSTAATAGNLINPSVAGPMFVVGDVVRKVASGELTKREGEDAKTYVNRLGNEVGKSATGESLTGNQAIKDVVGGVSSAVGNVAEGAATGVRSAGKMAKEDIINPLFQSVRAVVNPQGVEAERGLQPDLDAIKQKAVVDAHQELEDAKIESGKSENYQDFLAARQKAERALKIIDSGGQLVIDEQKKQMNQAPATTGDLSNAESQQNVGSQSGGNMLKNILGGVLNAGKQAAGMTAYGIPLDILGRNIGGAISPNAQRNMSIYDQQNPNYTNINAANNFGAAQARLDAPNTAALGNYLSEEDKISAARAEAAMKQSQKRFAGALDLDSSTGGKFNDLLDAKVQMGGLKNQLKDAIASNDINKVLIVGNQMAAVASVANKQGVVNGEEVTRVMGAITAIKDSQNAGQFNISSPGSMVLSRKLWSGLNNLADVTDAGTTSKLVRYKNENQIPEEYFQRQGINLQGGPEVSTQMNVVTPEERDTEIARAQVFDGVKKAATLGTALPTAVASAWNGFMKSVGQPDLAVGENNMIKTDLTTINKQIEQYNNKSTDDYFAKIKSLPSAERDKLIKESVAYLMTQGNFEEAKKYLEAGAESKSAGKSEGKSESAPAGAPAGAPKAKSAVYTGKDPMVTAAIKQAQNGNAGARKFLQNKGIDLKANGVK